MKHAHTCTCISHGYLLIPTEFTRSHDALAKKLASRRILLLHLNHASHLFFTVTCQRQWHTRRYPDTYTKSNHNMPLLSPSPPSNQGAHEDNMFIVHWWWWWKLQSSWLQQENYILCDWWFQRQNVQMVWSSLNESPLSAMKLIIELRIMVTTKVLAAAWRYGQTHGSQWCKQNDAKITREP